MFVTATTVALVAWAVYVADCILIVDRGQAVYSPDLKTVRFGSLHYVLRQRPVVMLNPMTPWQLVIKSSPIVGGDSKIPVPRRNVAALWRIAALGAVQAVLVLLVIPLLLQFLPGTPLVAAVAAAYVVSLSIGIMLWRHRVRVHVSSSGCMSAAIGALLCLPLSINVARKAALASTSRFRASVLIRHMKGAAQVEARRTLLAQIEEARLETADGTARAEELQSVLMALRTGVTDVGG